MKSSLKVPDSFDFPFQPYDIQQNFMKSLYQVLDKGKIGIFESPTGTGKSLSLLCATLKFLGDFEEKTENDLRNSIENLNCEILSLLSSVDKTDDWITVQYEINQKKQQLSGLEAKLRECNNYNKKIEEIRRKIDEKEKSFMIRKKVLEDKPSDDLFLDINEDVEETDDDFLLADIESDSDDEEEDCKDVSFRPLQVFFCSRTHSQLTQLVGEVKSTSFGKHIRSVSLASRQNYCINESVKKLRNNALMNELCLELQKTKVRITKKDEAKNSVKSQKLSKKSCPYYKKNLESLRNLSLTKIMDIEELVKAGVREKSCPYYSSRSAVDDSQLIFVPYQILFNKSTREQCGVKLKDSIVIIDEAHNLIDTISQIHTASVTLSDFRSCHKQMIDYKMKYMKRFGSKNLLKFNQLIFITKQLLKFLELHWESPKAFDLHEVLSDASIYNINLVDILKFCEQTRFAQKIHGFSRVYARMELDQKTADDVKKNATKSLLLELQTKKKNKSKAAPEPKNEESENVKANEPQTNVIRAVLQFLECLLQRYDGGRILVSHDETKKEPSMKFLLLDPSSPFKDIINECHSVVLAGGTMKPTDELIEQLFRDCKDRVEIHSYGHVVPRDSILPIVLSHGCSGKEFLFTHVNKGSEIMLNEASITIANICKIVPGGIVCFFTSYDNLNRFYSYINDKKIIDTIKQKKDVYVEPRNSSKTEKILEDYTTSIKRKTGAIIFATIGGKLSEGMNFSDDLGRCVIVVGLPFPNKSSPELVEKISYINKTINPSAGSEYYENLCMKAVNQSIGRAIRHIGDYATVLLLDTRYQRQNIVQKLPDWIRQNLVSGKSYGKVHCEIASFFRRHEKP